MSRTTEACVLLLLFAALHGVMAVSNLPSHVIATTASLSSQLDSSTMTFQELLSRAVFKLLAEQLHFNYSLTVSPDMLYGSFTNGSWNGMVGQLVRKEADISIEVMVLNAARARVADQVYPILFNRHMILIPYARNESLGLSSVLVPFHYEVWTALAVFSVATAIALKFVSPKKKYTVADYLMGIGGIYTNQDFYLPVVIRNHRVQLALSGFCLAAVVIVNTYTSVLYSTITVPKYQSSIRNLADLADSDLIPLVQKGASYENNFLEAKNGVFKLIGDKLRADPSGIYYSIPKAVETVAAGKGAIILTETLLKEIIKQDYTKYGTCRLTLAAEPIQISNQAFLVPKKSPLRKPFDEEVIRFHDSGIINYFNRHLSHLGTLCLQGSPTKDTNLKPLKLTHFAGAFYILFLGYGLSFLGFIYDLFRFLMFENRKVPKSDPPTEEPNLQTQ